MRVIDPKSPRTGYLTQDATFRTHAIVTWHTGEQEELSTSRYIRFVNGRCIYCRKRK